MLALALTLALLIFQTPKASIEGIVVRADSGEPIANLSVNLYRLAPPVTPLQTVVTDKNGHFVFSGLDSGDYRVSADAKGYALESWMTQMITGAVPGRAVTIKDGQPVQDLQFRLMPEGLVSGRVLGTAGEPLVDVELQLVLGRYQANGRKRYANYAAVTTNDRGEYRFYGLQPGRYYLRAASPLVAMGTRPDLFAGRGTTDDIGGKYMPTFYPNATTVSESLVVEVKAGVHLEKFDVVMREKSKVRYRIQGRIADARGAFPPGAFYTFYRRPNEGQTAIRANQPNTDGTFEIPNLDPGTWVVVASVQAPAQRPEPGTSFAGFQSLYASAVVDLLDADASGLVLALKPVSLPGRLIVEDKTPMPAGLTVRLNNVDGNSPPPAVVRPDGLFEIVNASDGGEYDLVVTGLLPDMYIKEASFGALDLRYQPLRIPAGPLSPIHVEIGVNGASVSGTVRDQTRKSVGSAKIALVPDDRVRRDLFRFVTAEGDGRYSLRGVAPGDYKLFAFASDAPPYEAFDPKFLQPHEAHGIPIHVVAGRRETIDLVED